MDIPYREQCFLIKYIYILKDKTLCQLQSLRKFSGFTLDDVPNLLPDDVDVLDRDQ